MIDMHGGDGGGADGDANGRRDGDEGGGAAKGRRDGDGDDAGMIQAKAIGEGEANGGDGDRRRQGQWRRM